MKIKFFKMDRGKTVQPAAASGQVLHNITFFLTNAKKKMHLFQGASLKKFVLYYSTSISSNVSWALRIRPLRRYSSAFSTMFSSIESR